MSLTVNVNINRLALQLPPSSHQIELTAPLPEAAIDSVLDLAQARARKAEAAVLNTIHGSANMPRHTRIAADGTHLPASDTTTPHVAVIDHTTGLMWSVDSLGNPEDADEGLPHAECEKRARDRRLLNFNDWRLPTRTELAGLVDDTCHAPAIDTALFPGVKPRWHWTSTPAAWSSSDAWSVYFDLGDVDSNRRDGGGFALAVRRVGQ